MDKLFLVTYIMVAVAFGLASWMWYPWDDGHRVGCIPQAIIWPLGLIAWASMRFERRAPLSVSEGSPFPGHVADTTYKQPDLLHLGDTHDWKAECSGLAYMILQIQADDDRASWSMRDIHLTQAAAYVDGPLRELFEADTEAEIERIRAKYAGDNDD